MKNNKEEILLEKIHKIVMENYEEIVEGALGNKVSKDHFKIEENIYISIMNRFNYYHLSVGFIESEKNTEVAFIYYPESTEENTVSNAELVQEIFVTLSNNREEKLSRFLGTKVDNLIKAL